jgi:hypothetical protein
MKILIRIIRKIFKYDQQRCTEHGKIPIYHQIKRLHYVWLKYYCQLKYQKQIKIIVNVCEMTIDYKFIEI